MATDGVTDSSDPPTALFPTGEYQVFADDDDVIGLTVAQTKPHGYYIVRTDPPIMDAFDEYDVAEYLAWCLTNAERLVPYMPGGFVATDGVTDSHDTPTELVQAVHDATHADESPQLRTLLFALGFPGDFDPADVDSEVCVHELVDMLNEVRRQTWLENGGDPARPDGEGRLTVSAIPGPQWITPATMTNLRIAALGVVPVLDAVPDGWAKIDGRWSGRWTVTETVDSGQGTESFPVALERRRD